MVDTRSNGCQSSGQAEATAGENSPALPLFYKHPQPVTAEGFRGKSLKIERDFRFAAETNSVPLNLPEFVAASKVFPIVFTISDRAIPVAILGIKDSQNLFVDEAGNWIFGAYIPAYVRRYPFVFTTGRSGDELILCIDDASDLLEDGDARPLYVDGEPSDVLKEALEFCNDFQNQHRLTTGFMAEMQKHDLLIVKEMTYTSPDGKRYSLAGFRLIDEEKFNTLADEVFLDWRQRGWLPFIYCHFLSVSNLAALGLRAAQIDSSAD